ncbi:large ribosomal subunit protein uL5-like [Vicia villosa]|uniref:large ribosomal subunit protein uL5-like n=1 Tax=Vicia villosa TaxID=3911 RepID=UPI00273C0760|nr:large ribosomal subunit protein uL5-like [Vicia villosa]
MAQVAKDCTNQDSKGCPRMKVVVASLMKLNSTIEDETMMQYSRFNSVESRYTVRSFGYRRNEKMACYVTVSGDKAMQLLESGLKVKEYELLRRNSTILDVLALDPSTDIQGMDFFVVLERPGYCVGRRRRCKAHVGFQYRVTEDDAMKWCCSGVLCL